MHTRHSVVASMISTIAFAAADLGSGSIGNDLFGEPMRLADNETADPLDRTLDMDMGERPFFPHPGQAQPVQQQQGHAGGQQLEMPLGGDTLNLDGPTHMDNEGPVHQQVIHPDVLAMRTQSRIDQYTAQPNCVL